MNKCFALATLVVATAVLAARGQETLGPPTVQAVEPLHNGQPLSFWLDGLDNPDRRIRQSSARALGQIGTPARIGVPRLMLALTDSSRGVRLAATEALGQLGPAAREAVPALVALLRPKAEDFDNDLCLAALEALGKIGAEARAAVPELLRLIELRDDDMNWRLTDRPRLANGVRMAAATTLAQVHEPNGIGKVIAALLAHRTFTLQLGARQAQQDVERRMQVLLKAVQDADVEVRRQALRSLYEVAAAAFADEKLRNSDLVKQATVQLEKLAKQEENLVLAVEADSVLQRLRQADSLDTLKKLVDTKTRAAAIDAMAQSATRRDVLVQALGEIRDAATMRLVVETLERRLK